MFRELEIMKTLRLILIAVILTVASVLSVVKAAPQGLAKQPEMVGMRSTSTMPMSGTRLPQAAAFGSETTYGEFAGPPRSGHIRKEDGDGDGFEDEDEPDAPYDPYPIGDAALPLALLALAYLIVRVARTRKRDV